MRILHSFTSARPEWTIGELSGELGLHKSDASRLVAVLRDWGMIEKSPITQKLRVGEGAFRIGSLYAFSDKLVWTAKAYLNGLVVDTGHSAHVTVLDGDKVLVVVTVESPNALRVIMRLGEHRPLHSTAAGKLFLAYADDLATRTLSGSLGRLTESTIVTPSELKRALSRIRREGVAWNRGENSVGAGAVAAPIFDAGGKMIAALSTVYPLQVVDAAARQRVQELTQETAKLISAKLEQQN